MKGQGQQGLTLIEVLVALAIFAIVSVAVLSMFPTIFRLNAKTRADQATTITAKQFMEGVRVNFGTQPGFDAGTTPATPTGCAAPAVTNQLTSTAGTVLIKRVTLTCTPATQASQSFVLDLGRPS